MTIKKINKTYQDVPMERLRIGRHQVRTRSADAGLDELAQSIRKIGLLQPIVVMPSPDEEGNLEILAGQRRFLACQKLGCETISAMVFDETPDNDHAITISLTKNLMRRDAPEKKYIDACTRLFEKYGDTRIVAEETGLPVGKVNEYIKAPQLTEALKRAVRERDWPMNLALIANEYSRDADGRKNEKLAFTMAKKMVDEGMGSTNARKYAKRVQDKLIRAGKVTDDDLDEATAMHVPETRLSITLEPKVDNALGDYSMQMGADKTDAASALIAFALTQKGVLPVMNDLFTESLPDALRKTLGDEKDRKLLRRSLTPWEAAREIHAAISNGWIVSRLAKELNITTTVIRYLRDIGGLPLSIEFENYLSPYWGESQTETKRQNKLSFSALGVFAAFVNDKFDDDDIQQALDRAIYFSLSKSDMMDAQQIQHLRGIKTALETIETVAHEKGAYGSKPREIVQQAILIRSKGHDFSDEELDQLKKAAEDRVGPVVSTVYKQGPLIGMEFIPGKISDAKMDELLSAVELQSMADKIREGKSDI